MTAVCFVQILPARYYHQLPLSQLQQSLPGCYSPCMNSCSSFPHKEVQIQPFCKFLLSKQTDPTTTHPPQNLLQVSAPQHGSILVTASSGLALEYAKHVCHCDSFPPIPLPFLFPAPLFSHFSFDSPMGGRQTETCSRAEITVHSMVLKLSRIIDFPKISQWALK